MTVNPGLPVPLLAFLLLLAPAQDPPPKAPPPDIKPPAAQEPPKKERERDEILYEIARFKRPDGLISICFRVGHERGRLLKAILEGVQLQIPGQAMPIVSVTPNARVKFLTDKGHVLESEEAHLLIVSDTEENIPYLESVLKVLDAPEPQVQIEARIVELRWDRELQLGLEGEGLNSVIYTLRPGSDAFLKEIRARFNPTEALAGGPFQGSTFRFGRTSAHQGSLTGVIQAFVQRGQGEVLSVPRIVASSGKEALILAGEKIPYTQSTLAAGQTTVTVQFEEANVSLKVRPHIVGSSNIRMEIDTSVKTLIGFVNFQTGTAPTFSNRQAKTDVTVRTGEEVWIGGILQKEKSKIRRGLPILSDIPVFGVLFGRYEESESLREILFTLKPTILEPGGLRAIIDPNKK
jgi:type IV pilus assembly protein PilQ